MPEPLPPLPLAVLISGGGTTLRNLLDTVVTGQLPVDIRLVISSSPRAAGLEFARAAGVASLVVEPRAFATAEEYSRAVFDPCRQAGVGWVAMGGFLKHVPIPADYTNRVLNIHPSLIPAFCGHGFYGHRVHQAVLDYGAKLSGCTVHLVDNDYDHGPIVLQRAVEVRDDDTADSLAARVFAAECELYPQALRLVAQGRLSVSGRRVHISKDASTAQG